MYEMKKEYFTGIELIDSEHRQLFDYANQIYELLHAEFVPDKYDNILVILDKIICIHPHKYVDQKNFCCFSPVI